MAKRYAKPKDLLLFLLQGGWRTQFYEADKLTCARRTDYSFGSLPTFGSATPVTDVGYGYLRRDFESADLIVGAQVLIDDAGCVASIPWAKGRTSCRATIQINRVYKGSIVAGDSIVIEYQLQAPLDPLFKNVVAGDYALFVLCHSGQDYVYCPRTYSSIDRAFMTKPATSSEVNGQSGIEQLTSDLIDGLQSGNADGAYRDAHLLWAVGDITTDQMDRVRATEMSLDLPTQVLLDAVLVRSDPTNCGADLSAVSKLSSPYEVDINRIADAVEHSGVRCLAQVQNLANSPSDFLRLAAINIIRRSRDSNYVPLLITLLDDKDPNIAIESTKALERLSGLQFDDKPSFEDFVKKKEVRDAYVREWVAWSRSQGYQPGKSSTKTGSTLEAPVKPSAP